MALKNTGLSVSFQGLDLIKRYESLSLVPYRCPAGLETIGYGHVIRHEDRFLKPPITSRQADNLLLQDVEKFEQAIRRLITYPLNQNQFDALVSFTFNCGAALLQRSTLRMQINRGELKDASETFNKYIFAKGMRLKGLVRRRQEESALFLKGSDYEMA